ncbi:ATP-binding protein [Lactiplantibacillus plantarum]|uniref:ATP-binding protein n=1 Tax=Lactiplantibacillus plantarum TaxID=1590 RepID=UPI00093394EF|nr:ATP-binding protein [Lactiplantibacillus plantarum]
MYADKFYNDIAKENFYLGIVSKVFRECSYVQIENLSLLKHRKIRNEILIPNTINFFVIVEDVQGLFFGEVYQETIQGTESVHNAISTGHNEKIYPEMAINVTGLMDQTNQFRLSGFRTVGINDKVYIANDDMVIRYLKSLEVNNYQYDNCNSQKSIANFAKLSGFSENEFSVQPNTLFDRHLMVLGATNSGKSTSALSILDKLIQNKRKVLMIDPTGEYKDSFDKHEFKKLTLGEDTFLSVGQITIPQWELLFQTNDNTQGAVLGEAIKSLKFQYRVGKTEEVYEKHGKIIVNVKKDLLKVTDEDLNFQLSLLPKQIEEESVEEGVKNNEARYVTSTFKANVNTWLIRKIEYVLNRTSVENFIKIFGDGEEGSLINELDDFIRTPEKSLYIDVSKIGVTDGIGSMIVDLISNHVINQEYNDPFIMFIDEAHRYTKFHTSFGEFGSGLVSIAREGRKKGIFLFLTSQSPKDVPNILLSQMGSLLIHRLTSMDEIQVVQNFLDKNEISRIKNLGQGEAVLASINLLQNIQLKFIESGRTHYNKTPVL